MFRKELQEKLQTIFDLKKTTYDAPSESHEQETLFVEINECRSRITAGEAIAEVSGTLVVYTQSNKLPFGFFNKRIAQADPSLTKDFFFFEMDRDALNSQARIQNISERRCRFVYLFSDQYDPNQGELTSIEFGDET